MVLTFKDLIAPLSEKDFFNDYYGKQYIHIKNPHNKKGNNNINRADLFGWDDLNAILNMALVWSETNTHLVLDKKIIPAREFCRRQIDRNKHETLVPDQTLVTQWLNKGASIVLDDMDGLAPGSRDIAGILQESMSAKVQANLYCSWKQRQAFDVHYDTHDVFAVHFAGEKIWNIYETRINQPVQHPQFLPPKEQRAKECGAIKTQVCLQPGDVLYIPKGQYHDALATEDNAVHIAFGIHNYLGLDFVKDLNEGLVFDEAFRVPLPLPHEGEEALREHVKLLASKMAAWAESPQVFSQIRGAQEAFRYPHHDFSLPIDVKKIEKKPDRQYNLAGGNVKITEHGGKKILVKDGQGVPMPDEFAAAVTWIVSEKYFTDTALKEEFFADNSQKGDKLLQDLTNMGVIKLVQK